MKKKENIVSYSADELRRMVARGDHLNDWARANAMTYDEIEAAIASDPDEAGMEVDWTTVTAGLPQPKRVLNMRVDHDVMDYFRKQGKGYQTKINAVLRAYVEQMSRAPR